MKDTKTVAVPDDEAPKRPKPGDLYLTCGGTIVAYVGRQGEVTPMDLTMTPVDVPDGADPGAVEMKLGEGVRPEEARSAAFHAFPEAETIVAASRVLRTLSQADPARYPFEGLEMRLKEGDEPRAYIGSGYAFVNVTGMDKAQATAAIVAAQAELPEAPGWPAPGAMDQATVRVRVGADDELLNGTRDARPGDPASLAQATLEALGKDWLAGQCTTVDRHGDTFLSADGMTANVTGSSPASVVIAAIKMGANHDLPSADSRDGALERVKELDPVDLDEQPAEDRGRDLDGGMEL